MDYRFNSFNDRFFYNLPLHSYMFVNNWYFDKSVHYFFHFYSFDKRFLHSHFHNFHCLLNYRPVSKHFDFYWLFYYVSNFNNFLYYFRHLNYSILHLHNGDNFFNDSVNWDFFDNYLVLDLRSRVIDWFFDNNLFDFFDFNNFWYFSHNFLNSFHHDFNGFQNFNYFLSWDYFFNFDINLFIFWHFDNNFFHNFFYFFNFNNFLDYLLNFHNSWHLSNHFHWFFDYFRYLYNFLYNLRCIHQFLHIDCLHFWNFHRHISHIFYHLNLFHFNRNFNSIFCCNKFRYFNYFLDHFFHNFLNLNYFRYSSIHLQNIINVNNFHNLLFYETDDSFINFWYNSRSSYHFFHFCEESFKQNS